MADVPRFFFFLSFSDSQEAGTWEAHEKFLADRTADAHVVPLIGSYLNESATVRGTPSEVDEEEATYSEVYWVKEDRLGKAMVEQGKDDVRNWDRGASSPLFFRRGRVADFGWMGLDRPPCPCRLEPTSGPATRSGVAPVPRPLLLPRRRPHGARPCRAEREEREDDQGQLLPLLVTSSFIRADIDAAPHQYFESVGFVREGSVVFPHKTAALMVCERNAFYELCPF